MSRSLAGGVARSELMIHSHLLPAATACSWPSWGLEILPKVLPQKTRPGCCSHVRNQIAAAGSRVAPAAVFVHACKTTLRANH